MSKPPEDPLSISFTEFSKPEDPVKIEATKYGIECPNHGTLLWSGEIICAPDKGGCGWVWNLGDDARCPPKSCGSDCVCGKPLHTDNPKCTALPICPTCFVQKWHEQEAYA